MPDPITELDEQKLSAARLWACNRWPYFATGLLAMQTVCAPGLGTFAIDEHWRVYIDPVALKKWTTRQVGVVLNHELQHLLRSHAPRARALGVGSADRFAWNVAADAEINDDLFNELSKQDAALLTPVVPKSIGAEPGRMAEHYFMLIQSKDHSGVADEGSGVHGLARPGELAPDADSVTESEANLIRGATAAAVITHAKSHGMVGGGIERWARERIGASQDWRRILGAQLRRDISTTVGVSDYSYQRLSRRSSSADGVIFPAMVKPLLQIAIVVDTSGSVSGDMLADAFREVNQITKSMVGRGGLVQLIACDSVVGRVATLTSHSRSEIALVGGGGTDMGEGITTAVALHPRPHAIVVLTDGYSPWPATAPRVPVTIGLLGTHPSEEVPPWATTVRIDSNN